MAEIVYNLWSNKHQGWWTPGGWGYTQDRAAAGVFAEADAVRFVIRSSHAGLLSDVTCMVAAPQNWAVPDAH